MKPRLIPLALLAALAFSANAARSAEPPSPAGLTLFTLPAAVADKTPVHLASWTVEEHDDLDFLVITGTNGRRAAVPARPGAYGSTLAAAEPVLRTANLFDHAALYDALQKAAIPPDQLRAADVLAWDLHARTFGVPLHTLVGTARTSALRYGDARWRVGHTPETYARLVHDIPLKAVKLHIPGSGPVPSWGHPGERLTVDEILAYLRVVRETSPDKILAYDPHPQVHATDNPAEARRILEACDRYNYVWLEAVLPLEPKFWPDYAQLRKEFKVRLQNEESSLTFAEFASLAESGAFDQLCPATYVHTEHGFTPVLQMFAWVKSRPDLGLTINTHYPSAEHTQLAFMLPDSIFPYFEAPGTGDRVRTYTGVNLHSALAAPDGTARAPTWPGIYDIPWLAETPAP